MPVQRLAMPPDGVLVQRQQFGRGQGLHTVCKHEYRHDSLFLPAATGLASCTEAQFQRPHDDYWGIEPFHRAVIQVCQIERFHGRDRDAIQTHSFSALRAFVPRECQRAAGARLNWYEVKRNLFNPLIASFMQAHLADV